MIVSAYCLQRMTPKTNILLDLSIWRLTVGDCSCRMEEAWSRGQKTEVVTVINSISRSFRRVYLLLFTYVCTVCCGRTGRRAEKTAGEVGSVEWKKRFRAIWRRRAFPASSLLLPLLADTLTLLTPPVCVHIYSYSGHSIACLL